MFKNFTVKKRIRNFGKYLKDIGIEKAVISKKENIWYFLGERFEGDAILVFENFKPILYVSPLEFEEASRFKHVEIQEFPGWKKLLKNVQAVDNEFPYYYGRKIRGVVFLSDKINEMRSIKDSYEIKLIKKSAKICDKILERVNFRNKTEKDVVIEIDCSMKKMGAYGPSFDTIVASGRNSSKPHHIPKNKKIKDLVLIDCGADVLGYKSDTTRTFLLKKDEKMREVYEIVKNTKETVEDYISAGVKVKELDIVAKRSLGEYSKYFVHALGHGVGLEIHEKPTISSKSSEELKENMVIAIEPAVYLKKFGIRIEDLYLVKKNGFERLTKSKIPDY